MKKPKLGGSLYYASDKNIFDALTRTRVNAETLQELFLRRNIIVSTKTDREELAEYFSSLPHDLLDHHSISSKLGSVARKERLTSMDLEIAVSTEELSKSINVIKQEIEKYGDTVQISKEKDRVRLNVHYSTIDYGKPEFSQVQVRDGAIDLIKISDGYIIRNNHNEYINNIRDSLVGELEKQSKKTGVRRSISLFNIVDSTARSKFFHQLMMEMPGFKVKDVHEVYIYKSKPDVDEKTSEDDTGEERNDSHVERVFLRGNGVTRSKQLIRLLSDDQYYIVRVAWIAVEAKGFGQHYEIEARFEDPKDCANFSFLLRGIYPADPLKGYQISSKRRLPTSGEVDLISTELEQHAKNIYSSMKA